MRTIILVIAGVFSITLARAEYPAEYQGNVATALGRAGDHRDGWSRALDHAATQEEKEALVFLMVNMSEKDAQELDADYLMEHVRYALKARDEAPWGQDIPQDIFLNDVLPYASVNERRDRWRKDFYERFMPTARKAKSIRKAVLKLNKKVFRELGVEYHASKRPKPHQSPYESMEAHYASCTGLSILLVDVLRSVGIPARIAGIPQWKDKSGNHTWVEVWDGEWHFVGAAEPGPYNETWFTKQAADTDASAPEHRIYATSFKPTGVPFPMIWAPEFMVPGIDVTERYLRKSSDE